MIVNSKFDISNIKEKKKYLLAVSGGIDSVYLFYQFILLKEMFDLEFAVFHLDHTTRNGTSTEDAIFVKSLCEKKGIKCFNYKIDIKKYKEKYKSSFQDIAHKIRIFLIKKTLKKYRFDFAVLAHHLDDLIETIFINILSGTGLDGMAPFYKKRKNFLYPLLKISKKEIIDIINRENIEYRQDITNFENVYKRNKIRNLILPNIELYFKDYRKHFFTLYENIKYDSWFLKRYVIKLYNNIKKRSEFRKNYVLINKNLLLKYDIAIIKRVIRIILYKNFKLKIDREKTDRILEFLYSKVTGKKFELNKEISIYFSKKNILFYSKHIENIEYLYKINNKIEFLIINEIDIKIDFEIISKKDINNIKKIDNIQFISYNDLNFPLYIRNYSYGDKIKINKKGQLKKINRVFIDKKIEKPLRNFYPIIVDKNNKNVSIIGVFVSSDYNIKDSSKILKVSYSNILE